ncbi:DNA mismatch repair protein msh6 [Gonapodya sp. JEL0774]|nr:DNA mismatch repair protein msh6 [Gonapodya sp. JEL0774]
MQLQAKTTSAIMKPDDGGIERSGNASPSRTQDYRNEPPLPFSGGPPHRSLFKDKRGQPLKFYFMRAIFRGEKDKKYYKDLIERHGGNVIDDEGDPALFAKVAPKDYETYRKDIVELEFVEESVHTGELADKDDFMVLPRSEVEADSTRADTVESKIGRAHTRNAFTDEDDKILRAWLRKAADSGDNAFGGNAIYKKLAEKHYKSLWEEDLLARAGFGVANEPKIASAKGSHDGSTEDSSATLPANSKPQVALTRGGVNGGVKSKNQVNNPGEMSALVRSRTKSPTGRSKTASPELSASLKSSGTKSASDPARSARKPFFREDSDENDKAASTPRKSRRMDKDEALYEASEDDDDDEDDKEEDVDEDEDEFASSKGPTSTKQKAKKTFKSPRRLARTRTAFSENDVLFLLRELAEEATGTVLGTNLYDRMAKKNPRHTAKSYREHVIKVIKPHWDRYDWEAIRNGTFRLSEDHHPSASPSRKRLVQADSGNVMRAADEQSRRVSIKRPRSSSEGEELKEDAEDASHSIRTVKRIKRAKHHDEDLSDGMEVVSVSGPVSALNSRPARDEAGLAAQLAELVQGTISVRSPNDKKPARSEINVKPLEAQSSFRPQPVVAKLQDASRPALGTGQARAPVLPISQSLPPQAATGRSFLHIPRHIIDVDDEQTPEQLAAERQILALGRARARGQLGGSQQSQPLHKQPVKLSATSAQHAVLKTALKKTHPVETPKVKSQAGTWEENYDRLVEEFGVAVVRKAVYMTSGYLDVAEKLLQVGISKVEELPTEIRLQVWTEMDDATLQSLDSGAIAALSDERGAARLKSRRPRRPKIFSGFVLSCPESGVLRESSGHSQDWRTSTGTMKPQNDGIKLTSEQVARMEANKRKAQEKLNTKSSSTQKSTQKASSSTPLLQKSITSFFTPGIRSSSSPTSNETGKSKSVTQPANVTPLFASQKNAGGAISSSSRPRPMESFDLDSDDDALMSLVDENGAVPQSFETATRSSESHETVSLALSSDEPNNDPHSRDHDRMDEDDETMQPSKTRLKRRTQASVEAEDNTSGGEVSKPGSSKRRRLICAREQQTTKNSTTEQDEHLPDSTSEQDSDYEMIEEDGDISDSNSIDDFVVSDDDDEALFSSKRRKKSSASSSGPSNARTKKRTSLGSNTSAETRRDSGSSLEGFRPERLGWNDLATPSKSMGKGGIPDKLKTFMSSTTKRKELPTHFSTPVKSDSSPSVPSNYDFLLEDRIRDADGRRPDDPDYDPRTVFIPPHLFTSKNGFTEFEKQYWEIKSKFFDTIVFFKKGKFYELYDKDADIAHQQFDLRLANTDRAHMRMAGVPESVVDDWVAQFLAKGHKVAKVDQVETAVGKRMAKKNGQVIKSKADSIIKRELTQVLTTGTLTDPSLLTSDMATYCMSIKEDLPNDEGSPSSFSDDVSRSTLETLLTQVQPKEIVFEKGHLSSKTTRLIKASCPAAAWIGLTSEAEFWDADRALLELQAASYFGPADNNGDDETIVPPAGESDAGSWPSALLASKTSPALMSAMGGILHHLRTLKLDRELISQAKFSQYDPMRRLGTLLLDGQTLKNLEILLNKDDGTTKGTLLERVQNCTTPFGKRLLRRWLCHPLRSKADIDARLDCVDDLAEVSGLIDTIETKLRKLPDMERTLSRVHSGACRPKEFTGLLRGMQLCLSIFSDIQPFVDQFSAVRLIKLCTEGMPSNLAELIENSAKSFDMIRAESDNIIKPSAEADELYAECEQGIEAVQRKLREYLLSIRKDLKCNTVNFRDMGKDRYLLEMPRKRNELCFTQDVHRFYTPSLQQLVEQLEEAEELLKEAEKGAKSRLYAKFDENSNTWTRAVNTIAELDCLLSLVRTKTVFGEPICRPSFLEEGESFVEFEELRHPCLTVAPGESLIPNNTMLGGDHPPIVLLTGPNMGGKSTLLRQVCVGVILAQMGCYVPATSCRLKPVDRIFTRIGANDNILAGHSTFFVELAETSRILKEATTDSLVILDELGRGTSTHDGYAVAYSVLHHLVESIGCLGLFTTHHAMLTEEFKDNPLVLRSYMNFQNDDERREVTFLYKLVPGISQKSYGMNVAAMAGVPREVVDKADAIAQDFETQQGLQRARARAADTNLAVSVQADFAFLASSGTGDMANEKDAMAREIMLKWKSLKGIH